MHTSTAQLHARPHSHHHTGRSAATAVPAASAGKPKLYNPRHPERTLLYQTIAEHFETWHELASAGQFDGQGDHHTPKPYVRQAFRKYLECGIFAHGFARAWCDDCGHDYFVAYSCKGRGVCPSCNTRRMVETAAHLCDHVFPRLPVRQWVLSVPKRLRYFMQRDGAVLNMVLRIFLRVIAQSLQDHCAGAAPVNRAALHIGAVAFTSTAASRWTPVCVFRHTTAPRWSGCCAAAPTHPLLVDRLRKEGAELVYRCAKQRSEPGSDKRGAKADELHLTPLELIARIAALVPPPRTHRHRYFGVLAPNSPHRAEVTDMAQPAKQVVVQAEPAVTGEGAPAVVPLGHAILPTPEPAPPKRSPAHYLWAVLIARIYEVFPLLCPKCGGQMRLIAFITEGTRESGRSLITSGLTPSPHTSARRAGHRCGMTVVTRRWMTGHKSSQQTGIWRRNRNPTTRSISASVGD